MNNARTLLKSSLSMLDSALKKDESENVSRTARIGVVQVDAKLCRMNDFHRRLPVTMSGSAIQELGNLIAASGQTQPAKGWKLESPDANGFQYVLIYGARRRAACELMGVPLTVELVPEPTQSQTASEMLMENMGRADYAPLELAYEIQALLEKKVYPDRATVVSKFKMDQSRFTRVMDLLSLPPEVLTLFEAQPAELRLVAGGELVKLCRELDACEMIVRKAVELHGSGDRTNMLDQLLAVGKMALKNRTAPVSKPKSSTLLIKDDRGNVVVRVHGFKDYEKDSQITLTKKAPKDLRKSIEALLEEHAKREAKK